MSDPKPVNFINQDYSFAMPKRTYADLFSDDSEQENHRHVLQDQYLDLTRTILPAKARLNGWPIKEDHCFMRIVLDKIFGDCWYNHLDQRLVAYKQLSNTQLKTAIQLASAIRDQGEALLMIWNHQSLQWRGKV